MTRPEILLTTPQHVRGDAMVDRDWQIIRHCGFITLRKPDGSEVRPVYSLSGLAGLPPGAVAHLGYGFERWSYPDYWNALLILRARSCINGTGGQL